MQWIQDPSQSNVDNFNNIRRDVSRHFRNKTKVYLKVKIEELETNSKNNSVRVLYRGINDFKKGYQPRRERRFGGRSPQYYGEVEELFLSAIECTWG